MDWLSYLNPLMEGAWVTIRLALYSSLLGAVFSFLFGIGRLSRSLPCRWTSSTKAQQSGLSAADARQPDSRPCRKSMPYCGMKMHSNVCFKSSMARKTCFLRISFALRYGKSYENLVDKFRFVMAVGHGSCNSCFDGAHWSCAK